MNKTSRANPSKTWWGQSFIAELERFTDRGRLTRGKAYRTDKRVKQWDIDGHKVTAKIRGNINHYFGITKEPVYTTTLSLKTISAKQWDKLVTNIGENAGFICKLMMNEMPDDIETPLKAAGLYLLPHSMSDFTVNCTCPDHEVPCKHIAGVCYRLAEQLDHDPLLLFQLRGLSHQQLHKQLAKTPLGKALLQSFEVKNAQLPTQNSYYTRPKNLDRTGPMKVKPFWQGQAPNSPVPSNEAADKVQIPALLIKKGGDYPPFWHSDNSFIDAMEAYYRFLEKQGRKLL